jgi:hypothetical protein
MAIHMRLLIDECQAGQELVPAVIDWVHPPKAVRIGPVEQVVGSSEVDTLAAVVFGQHPSGVLAQAAVHRSFELQCVTRVM